MESPRPLMLLFPTVPRPTVAELPSHWPVHSTVLLTASQLLTTPSVSSQPPITPSPSSPPITPRKSSITTSQLLITPSSHSLTTESPLTTVTVSSILLLTAPLLAQATANLLALTTRLPTTLPHTTRLPTASQPPLHTRHQVLHTVSQLLLLTAVPAHLITTSATMASTQVLLTLVRSTIYTRMLKSMELSLLRSQQRNPRPLPTLLLPTLLLPTLLLPSLYSREPSEASKTTDSKTTASTTTVSRITASKDLAKTEASALSPNASAVITQLPNRPLTQRLTLSVSFQS